MKRSLPLATLLTPDVPSEFIFELQPYQRRYFVYLNQAAEQVGEIKPSRIVHGPQRKGRGGKIKKW